jgi:hypothetical protein
MHEDKAAWTDRDCSDQHDQHVTCYGLYAWVSIIFPLLLDLRTSTWILINWMNSRQRHTLLFCLYSNGPVHSSLSDTLFVQFPIYVINICSQ